MQPRGGGHFCLLEARAAGLWGGDEVTEVGRATEAPSVQRPLARQGYYLTLNLNLHEG